MLCFSIANCEHEQRSNCDFRCDCMSHHTNRGPSLRVYVCVSVRLTQVKWECIGMGFPLLCVRAFCFVRWVRWAHWMCVRMRDAMLFSNFDSRCRCHCLRCIHWPPIHHWLVFVSVYCFATVTVSNWRQTNRTEWKLLKADNDKEKIENDERPESRGKN